jgi:preprotein translocase subunit SecG
MLLMVLVLKVLVLVELLLVVHEESGFLSASIGTQEDTRATAKGDKISPSCFVQI